MAERSKFINPTYDYWTEYFQKIQLYTERGDILSSGKQILYPNLLLFTETKNYFLAELIGAQPYFNGLKIKRHDEKSINRYLNQFDDDTGEPVFNIDASISLVNLCFLRVKDLEFIESRFPVVKHFLTHLSHPKGGKGAFFSFGRNFEYLLLDNCVLVNRCGSIFRAKHILHLTVLSKNISVEKYRSSLTKFMNLQNLVKGVHTCTPGKEHDYVLAGQLQNLYLFPGLRETTVGEFLKTHPEILKKGLSAKDFIYEPYLPWIESPPENQDRAINPDLLVQRQDGFYDVYDLKTAALQKRKLTKGARRRRRFIDYVEEGAAQLANYREYLSYSANLDFVREKYGAEFKNPRYVLIVGNYDNAERREIREASRKLDNITVFDYDTLVQLFLGSAISG